MFLFYPNPCLPLLNLLVLWLLMMLSLPIHHIIFVECFHPCIVLQVSIGIFPIGNMRMLKVFLYHLSLLTSKLNLRPSFPPGTSSPLNFLHVSSSIKICLSIMTLFRMILPNQPTQYILVTLAGKEKSGKSD